MSATILFELLAVQRAIANGSAEHIPASTAINPQNAFAPNSINVWINGFWSVSLTCSLGVALAAVLVKQWLHHYMSLPSGTPGIRSHIRHFRYMGLERWRVRVIIGMLPLIMHISLALFLAGFTLFFIPLRTSIAYAIGTITVVLCVLYLASNALPIMFPNCPYQTPLTDFFHFGYQMVNSGFEALHTWFDRLERVVGWRGHYSVAPSYEAGDIDCDEIKAVSTSMATIEIDAVHSNYDTLSVDALHWLFHMSSNPSLHSVVLQAIGGLPGAVKEYAEEVWEGAHAMRVARRELIQESTTLSDGGVRECLPEAENTLERLCRSFIFLPRKFDAVGKIQSPTGDDRLKAAIWIARVPRTVDQQELRDFLSSSHHSGLHPFVWKELVKLAADYGTFHPSDPKMSASYAHLITVFLPTYSPAQTSTSALRMTLRDTVNVHLPDIWNHLLNMPVLSPFISHSSIPLSPYYRAILAAGKFAVHHLRVTGASSSLRAQSLSNPNTEQDWHHLELLKFVLDFVFEQLFNSDTYAITQGKPQPYVFPGVIYDFLLSVVNRTTICDYSAPGPSSCDDALRKHLNDCLSNVLRIYAWFAKADQLFAFPSFRRVLQVPVHRLSDNADFSDPSWSSGIFGSTFDIMSFALSRGVHEAYALFVDDNWIQVLAELEVWATGFSAGRPMNESAIAAFISGLKYLQTERDVFVEYIHQPRNLVIAFISTFSDARQFAQLLKLCPRHASWRECGAIFRVVSDWNQNCAHPEDERSFPLNDFFDGKVLQLSSRSVVLDDSLQKMFTGNHVGQVLKSALRLLDESQAKVDQDVSVTPTLPSFLEGCQKELISQSESLRTIVAT
ncbi:hypothetical protein BDZ89DRAFT_1183564 [Hymenopellis radicata]|nr:hypothetical protein BDZ89DRAFT_1183564 [Hymenopellis radicata]